MDMRLSFDGLAARVQHALGRDPYSGECFVFRGKEAGKLKMLLCDGLGFWIQYRRLGQAGFVWPALNERGVIELPHAQLMPPLAGASCVYAWRIAELEEETASVGDFTVRTVEHARAGASIRAPGAAGPRDAAEGTIRAHREDGVRAKGTRSGFSRHRESAWGSSVCKSSRRRRRCWGNGAASAVRSPGCASSRCSPRSFPHRSIHSPPPHTH
ncbi:MAG: IS66 family insertion sequence element accessory protein TnpB [Burkholderiales bacterium]|nr:IS66 family insertion sequence element accessory protein TnpB [Burkholderiales bacterium]